MFNKQKKSTLSYKIFSILFISPILLSIPLITGINEVKAGLEFQWNQDSGFRRLRWFQKEKTKRLRNTIYFFLRPSDRKADLLKLSLSVPKTFKTKIKAEKITLCKVRIGGFDSRTKCLENIPADIEIKDDKSSIDIYPFRPIPANKDSFAIVLKVFNPNKSGLFQFHNYGQYTGQTVSSYLGSSTIVID